MLVRGGKYSRPQHEWSLEIIGPSERKRGGKKIKKEKRKGGEEERGKGRKEGQTMKENVKTEPRRKSFARKKIK